MRQLNATIVPLQECTLAFAPSFAPCSNNGHCVRDPTLNRSVCVCNDGWSGYSDFGVTTSQTNCQINNDIIRALWAVLLFVSIVGWIIAYPKAQFLYEKHQEKASKAKSQGRTYRLWHNSGFFSCFSFHVVGFPLVWALCILKLANPDLHVGVDWAPTMLWWCIRFFVYFSTFTMQPALLSSLLRGTNGLENVVLAHRWLSNACFFAIIVCQSISIRSVTADIDPFNPYPGYDSIIIFASGIAVPMCVSAAQAIYIERKVISALNQSMTIAKDEKTKRLKEKLTSMQSAFLATMIVQATIYGFLAAAPFMWPLHDYFLPISWLALPALNVKSFNSIMPDEEEKKSHAKKQTENNYRLGGENTDGTPTNKTAADETFSIMDDGQVANIDGATISVVQHETVDVDINDTFVPQAAKMALHVSQYLVHRSLRYTFAFATFGLLSALMAIALAMDQLAAAIIFLIVVTLGCLALFLTTLSKKVLVELWHTDFLRFRIVVTLLGTGLLTDALGGTSDARSMVAPALGMLQLIAFCTDALVTPLFRSSIVLCANNTTFTTWVFIFWDLVPNIRNTVIPIGSGYSLLQASRDILLAQWTLFLVEGRFVLRGRDHKRFLHITRPVEKILLSNDETQSRETVRQHKRMGNASTVMMQSGFVMHQASQTVPHDDRTMASVMDGESPLPHKARVRVYVNKVAVKQASAILFAVFGFEEYAITAYSYLDGLAGRVMHAAALLLPLVTAIVLPFVPKSVSNPLCWACIPCTIIISLRQFSLLSITMAKLLVARVTFLPVVGLMLGWMILMCVVLGGDARCAVATFGALTYVWCDVLGDASTATPATYRVARVFTTIGPSSTILVMSIYFLTDQFVDVANVDWSVKALGETNSTQSNAPDVIDASQLVGDFGFFSIAVPTILQAIQIMLTFFKRSDDGKTNFKSIAAPVMPNYVQGEVKAEVMDTTTTLPVIEEGKETTPNDQWLPPGQAAQSHQPKRSQDDFKKHIGLVVKRIESTFAANETTADGVGDPRTMVQGDIEPEIIW